jgi:hypothetical protein
MLIPCMLIGLVESPCLTLHHFTFHQQFIPRGRFAQYRSLDTLEADRRGSRSTLTLTIGAKRTRLSASVYFYLFYWYVYHRCGS